MGEADLDLAARLGFVVSPSAHGTVSLSRGVLRYDPQMPPGERQRLVVEGLSEWAQGIGPRQFYPLHEKCSFA